MIKVDNITWNSLQQMIADIPKDVKLQNEYSSRISDKIAKTLKERGLTQRDLAEITGKRPSQVTCWLSGSHNFTLATIALISKALDIDLISIP